jgi:hypothetical protein
MAEFCTFWELKPDPPYRQLYILFTARPHAFTQRTIYIIVLTIHFSKYMNKLKAASYINP